MSQTIAEARFDKARRRLSEMLQELEEVVKNKIHEASELQVKIVGNDDESSQINVGGYVSSSGSLAAEINRLQNDLSEVGKETEFQKDRNQILIKKITNFQQEKLRLVENIERSIAEIEKLINPELAEQGGNDGR